jgi:Trk K+ transport system NAD-binding subunit
MPTPRTVDRIKSLAGTAQSGPTIAVVGGGRTGLSLAARLQGDGNEVRFLDESQTAIERAANRDVEAVRGDPVERAALERIDPDSVDVAVVAEPADERTALSAQLLRTAYDCSAIVVFVTDPENIEALEDMTLQVLTTPDILAGELRPIIDDVHVEQEGE